MIAVSRAPIAALQAYKRRMGWTFPWASSLDSDFNFDFNTSFTEDQQRSGAADYCGACTSGWTGRRRGTTTPGRGSARATSTSPDRARSDGRRRGFIPAG
jgi:predicted dithiol-disulfide oxidoreductase (DUF899 family)